MSRTQDVVIVGGGISGCALLYVLAQFSHLKRITLIEKESALASLNSHPTQNNQTLHFGDIETNYPLSKAKEMKAAAEKMQAFLEQKSPHSFRKFHKMVLAVGEAEVRALRKRFEAFSPVYPKLQWLDRAAIGQKEPALVEGRPPRQKMAALWTPDGYAVDYQSLARSFVSEAQKSKKDISLLTGETVETVEKKNETFQIKTASRTLSARSVALTAGPHSLLFSQKLGLGRHLGILPVAGSFYTTPQVLRGKVYAMQNPKLPFAAVHGDPLLTDESKTEFGPTAQPIPFLERRRPKSFHDFRSLSMWDGAGILSLLRIGFSPTLFSFALKNMFYQIPGVGKRLFLRTARKLVPLLQLRDLHPAPSLGGVRPQVIDTRKKSLVHGDVLLVSEGLTARITPPVGASSALDCAFDQAKKTLDFFSEPLTIKVDNFEKALLF
ncbi:MAG: FAD-dependent oxidoreductase [Candidatus Gracilibacteria bacterium]|nr:FAD-dependent oxidoreductase [Candidatus Gracilibacteria bacterium]